MDEVLPCQKKKSSNFCNKKTMIYTKSLLSNSMIHPLKEQKKGFIKYGP